MTFNSPPFESVAIVVAVVVVVLVERVEVVEYGLSDDIVRHISHLLLSGHPCSAAANSVKEVFIVLVGVVGKGSCCPFPAPASSPRPPCETPPTPLGTAGWRGQGASAGCSARP